MAIYIGLVFYVLCLPLVFYFFNPNGKNNNKYIAFFGMLGVFLVLALKDPSVGTDIAGYREQYYIAKQMSWSNFDYVYFEFGYIFFRIGPSSGYCNGNLCFCIYFVQQI